MMARYLEVLFWGFGLLCVFVSLVALMAFGAWAIGWLDRDRWARAWHELSGLWNVRP